MSWTDVFPVLTDDWVDEYQSDATPADHLQLEEFFGIARIVNPQPEKPVVVSLSLFWKNARLSDAELPTPSRLILENAADLGLKTRWDPWDHYVRPALELIPALSSAYPDTAFRIHLAADLEFLADELAAAGAEVRVMKSSSIRHAPGCLWRFLPLAESGIEVIVSDLDLLPELEGARARLDVLKTAGLACWRQPVANDLVDGKIGYLPMLANHLGVRGGVVDADLLLRALTWHALRGRLPDEGLYPGCGPRKLISGGWPNYGFDELFLLLAIYPRLAAEGMVTFVPASARSLMLTLDIEYVTWANPASELTIFETGMACC